MLQLPGWYDYALIGSVFVCAELLRIWRAFGGRRLITACIGFGLTMNAVLLSQLSIVIANRLFPGLVPADPLGAKCFIAIYVLGIALIGHSLFDIGNLAAIAAANESTQPMYIAAQRESVGRRGRSPSHYCQVRPRELVLYLLAGVAVFLFYLTKD
ncbi:MAG: hypothetical protein SF069_04645 [Phycisphaerae bacterium]|nr:hypothetical protein [Phycisphaerae bacterium]